MKKSGAAAWSSVLFVWTAAILGLTLHAQSATTIPVRALVQPQAFLEELQAHPHGYLILQVGSRVLFDEAHIPGAEYAGPASKAAGLEALRTLLARQPRSRAIVLYCGCCPWNHCPNIAPAWDLVQAMGFSKVRVLYLPDNFGTDWASHGYGTESSQ